MTHKRGGFLRAAGKLLYSLILVYVLGHGAYSLYQINIDFWYKLIDQSLRNFLFVSVASIVFVLTLNFLDSRLKRLKNPILEWSLSGRNVSFIPVDYVALRIPFLVLLYFNLPLLAWIEEMIFRGDWILHSTSGLYDAVWRSALFGAIHVPFGAKLRTGMLIFFCGLWLSWLFMRGGIEHATLAHLSMNVIGLTIMLMRWAKTGINPFTK